MSSEPQSVCKGNMNKLRGGTNPQETVAGLDDK